MTDKTTGRGVLNSTADTGNITYGVMPEQLAKELKENLGGEFILIQKVRQGEMPHVWSSGDPEQAKALFREAYTDLAYKDERTREVA